MKENSSGVGFDKLFDKIEINDRVGISTSGNTAISSTYANTLMEKIGGEVRLPPIEIFDSPSDKIGFFGRGSSYAAISFENRLMVVDLFQMKTTEIEIKSGSLFVPQSGNAPKIGAVSKKGVPFTIDERMQLDRHELPDRDYNEVLWSSNVTPVGGVWSNENDVNLLIKSSQHDKGSLLTSSYGIIIFSVWYNHHLGRHEAYLTTYDNPSVLRRIFSAGDGEESIEEVLAMPYDSPISEVICDTYGKPILAIGKGRFGRVIETIPPAKDISHLIRELLKQEHCYSDVRISGGNSYISWTQTPITPPIASVTNYGVIGRPSNKVIGASTPGSVKIPKINKIRKIISSDNQDIKYRFVSPYSMDGHMANSIAIVADYNGDIYDGKYSETVKRFYEYGIPTAIVPVPRDDPASDDYSLDILDVADDILYHKLGRNVVFVSEGRQISDVNRLINSRDSSIRNVVLIDPVMEEIGRIKRRKNLSKITIIDTIGDKNKEEALHRGFNYRNMDDTGSNRFFNEISADYIA